MANYAPHRPRVPSIKLTLTSEIIENAVPRDSGHCMWADAVKAAVPGARSVAVDLQTVRFTDPEKPLRYIYLTPRAAQASLVGWDDGTKPEPGLSVQIKGGQVVRASPKRSNPPSAREARVGKTAELRSNTKMHPGVPDTIGGRTPPTGPLSNTHYRGGRRAFGLRGLVL